MEPEELGCILSKMYHGARKGEKAMTIHLFGIKYAGEIHDHRISIAEIMHNASGVPESYGTEVRKGIKLACYVVPRAER